MDFSKLPDTAFLRIFDQLPWEQCIRIGRVSKSFRRISLLVTSLTKCLDLTEERFAWKLRPDQLRVLLDLCSQNLERIKFPGTYYGAAWVSTFSNYECPRLMDLDLDWSPIENEIFCQLIQKNRGLKSVNWKSGLNNNFDAREITKYVKYPELISENLMKLELRFCNDDTLRSLTYRCPNLESLSLVTKDITSDVFDQFIASIPQVQEIKVHFIDNHIAVEDLISFWDRPLTSLQIAYTSRTLNGTVFANDEVLWRIALYLPRLKNLNLWCIEATNEAVWSLGKLQDLERLKLTLPGDDFDDGIRGLAKCGRLQEFIVYNFFWYVPLIYLLRCCPHLRLVVVRGILDVKSGEEAASVLKGLSGMPRRDVTIGFHAVTDEEEARAKLIWQSDPVAQVIRELQESEGFEIKFEWVERQFTLEEVENVEEI